MKTKIPLNILLDDLLLPFFARNIKKIGIIFLGFLASVFLTFFFINKNNAKKEVLLSQYISAVGILSQGDSETALKKFETVYNSSGDLLEILSLIQIIDITIEKEQYKAFPKLLEEVLSLKPKPTTALLLYTKAVTMLEVVKQKGIVTPTKADFLTKTLVAKIKKLNMEKEFYANKNTLLLTLNEKIDKIEDIKPETELSLAVKLIEESK